MVMIESLCFKVQDQNDTSQTFKRKRVVWMNVQCKFGGVMVEGVFISDRVFACVSPSYSSHVDSMSGTDKNTLVVPLKLYMNGQHWASNANHSFTYDASIALHDYNGRNGVTNANYNTILHQGTSITLQWHTDEFAPTVDLLWLYYLVLHNDDDDTKNNTSLVSIGEVTSVNPITTTDEHVTISVPLIQGTNSQFAQVLFFLIDNGDLSFVSFRSSFFSLPFTHIQTVYIRVFVYYIRTNYEYGNL